MKPIISCQVSWGQWEIMLLLVGSYGAQAVTRTYSCQHSQPEGTAHPDVPSYNRCYRPTATTRTTLFTSHCAHCVSSTAKTMSESPTRMGNKATSRIGSWFSSKAHRQPKLEQRSEETAVLASSRQSLLSHCRKWLTGDFWQSNKHHI